MCDGGNASAPRRRRGRWISRPPVALQAGRSPGDGQGRRPRARDQPDAPASAASFVVVLQLRMVTALSSARVIAATSRLFENPSGAQT